MSTSVDGIRRDDLSGSGNGQPVVSSQNPVGASQQAGTVFAAVPVTPVPQRPSVIAAPSDTPAIFGAQPAPQPAYRRLGISPQLMKGGLISFGLLLAVIGGGYFVRHRPNSPKPQNVVTSNVSAKFNTINIPLSNFENSGQISVSSDHTLSINGQLKANNSLVISPTAQPSSALPGQMYYDQTTNRLEYYNGSQFVSLLNSNDNINTGVQSLGGANGALTVGSGLNVSGKQLGNTGVLSVQGQAGNISFTSGAGIAISGTTLSNSGLISLGGQSGKIALGAGLGLSGGTLSSTGVQSVSSDTPSLIVANDGNGNITLTNTGGGSATISSPGGTGGALAVFTGAQVIANSLVSQSGSVVTVGGNLTVTGSATLGAALNLASGGTGGTSPTSARSNLGAAASGSNSDITSLSGLTTALSVLQGGTGVSTLAANGVVLGNGTSALTAVAASGSGQCLVSTAGAPAWQSCPGATGVASLNGLTGALTIANASVAGSTVTLNDATTTTKGIASFNSANLTVSSGAVNTIQDINTTASPTFASINTNSINPSGSLTVGSNSQTLSLQGSSTSVSAKNGANTAALNFVAPTANVTYRLQTAAAGTYDVCTTAGNCTSLGGAVTTTGGTANALAKFTGSQAIGDSIITDNGTTVTVSGNLAVTGTTTLTNPLTVANGGTGAITPSAARTNLGAAAAGANSDITSLSGLTTALSVIQGGTGATSLTANGVLLGNGTGAISSLAAVSSGLCLVSGAGAPTWQSCPGGGGVSSIDGLNGALTLANSSGAGSTITIDTASTSQLGLAQFNSTNFSVSGGVANTVQNINVSATPTFGTLSLSSSQASNPMLLVNNTNAGASGNLLDLQLNGSSKLSVAPSGNLTIAGTITSGTVNGQTISSSANFTGTLAVGSTLTASGVADLNGGASVTGSLGVSGAANLNGGATVAGTLGANTITPSGALTLGATGQNATLQGATVSITSSSGANTAALNFVAPTANVTYRLQTAAAGTYDVCTTAGNCTGVGGGVTTAGGTTNHLAKFTGSSAIGDSIITDNGSTVTIGGTLAANTITPSAAMTVGATGQNLTLQGATVSLTSTSGGVTNSLTFATPTTTGKTITIPDASGTVAVSASGPLQLDASGNITCPDCVTSGGSGGGTAAVDSVDGLTGALTLANSVGAGTTITINNASTSQLGLAQFNSTNFSVSGGVANTVQDINTTAAPTFGRLTISSSQATNDMLVVNNTNASGTGKLLNVELNGAGKFTVDASGNVVATGTITSGTVNGQTISSAASLTGSLAVAGVANLNGGANVTGTLAANTITPSAAMTVGATGQNLTLQGASTSITGTSGANTTTLALQTPTANVTYRLLTAAAGTYDVCTTAGNCVGAGGGVTTGGGTSNTLPKFTGSQTIGNSDITDDGTTVTVGVNLAVTGTVSLSNVLTVSNGGTGAATASGARSNLGAAASGSNSDITSLSGLTTALSVAQGGTGAASLTANGVLLGNGTSAVSSLAAGGSNLCLLSTAGAPTWATCPGSGGVSSLDGLSGALTLANSSGAGSTVTIDNASTSAKGIASFNSTNFSVSSGAVNTVQDINTTAAPTFGALSLTSSQATAAMLAVNNTNVSATGNLLDLQLNGSSKLNVAPSGNLTLSGTVNGQTISSAANFTGTVAVGSTLTASGTANLNGGASVTGTLGVSSTANLNGGATVTGTLAANTITPSAAMTVGATGQSFTLQGSNASTITATSGANTTTVGFVAPTANVTYQFQTAAAGTYGICTTAGNCSGSGVTSAGGTANTIAMFSGSQTIANSLLSQDAGATKVTDAGNLTVSGTANATTALQAPLFDTASSGALAVGTTNATAINLNQNTTLAAGKNLTLASGTGTISQTYSNTSGTATTLAVTDSASSSATTVQGLAVNLTGTANAGGSNALSGISFGNVSAATNNSYYGINFGTGMTDLLRYNGTQLISGAGLVQNAAIDSTLTYSNLTKVGALAVGSIASGFGTISTGNNITTTATVQGGSGVFTGASSITVGTSSSNTGAIVFKGSGGTGTLTLQGPTTPNTGNFTLTLPTVTASGTLCTTTSCTLQTAYAAGSSGSPMIKLNSTQSTITIQDADSSLGNGTNFMSMYSSNGGGFGTKVLGFGIAGTIYAHTLTNSSTALEIQDSSSQDVLTVDTSTDTVNLGSTAASGYNGSTVNILTTQNANGTVQIGSNALGGSATQNIGIGNSSTANGTTNVNIGSGTNAAGGTTTVTAKGALTFTGYSASTWSTSGAALTVQGGTGLTLNSAASTTASTGAITLQSGNVSSVANTASGSVTIDNGTSTGTGAPVINIGTSNMATLHVGDGSNSARTYSIGDIEATSNTQAQTMWLGSNGGSSATTVYGGTGQISLMSNTLTAPLWGFGHFQNLLTYSEQLNNSSGWTATTLTATADQLIAPDGNTTADSLADTSSGGKVVQSTSTAVGSTYTFSVWLKTTSGNTQAVDLRIDGTTSGTGTKATVTATDHWQRFSVTQNTTTFSGNVKVDIFPGGTGGSNANTVYGWGAQLEQSSSVGTYTQVAGTAFTQSGTGFEDNGAALFRSTSNSATAIQVVDSSSNLAVVVSSNNVTGTANAANAIIKVAQDSGTGRSINASGTINASGADYAEYFYQARPGALQPGQTVCLNGAQKAEACSATSSDMLLGAVSSKPGYVGNDIFDAAHPDNTALVGLLGQIEVNVSATNGAIHAGDMLTISDQSGVAVKAAAPGMALGSALEDFDGSGQGKILVYVHVGYYAPSVSNDVQQAGGGNIQNGSAATLASLNVGGLTTLNNLNVTGTATIASLTVTNSLTTAVLTVNGHIISGGGAPTIAAGNAACSNANVQVSGTDTAGLITITTGTNCTSAGKLATVTFSSPYAAAPRVSLTPASASAAHLSTFVDSSTITGGSFNLGAATTPATNTTYSWYYQVIQ